MGFPSSFLKVVEFPSDFEFLSGVLQLPFGSFESKKTDM